jgi:hypothetical protein
MADQHQYPNSPLHPKKYQEKTYTVSFKVTESEMEEIKEAMQYRANKGYIAKPTYRDLFVPCFKALLTDPYSDDTFDINQ